MTLSELPELSTRDSIPVGLCDLPGQQTQRTYAIDLAHGGHVLIAGGPRSGRTTALRTVAGSLARTLATSDCHLHVLDCASGALSALRTLPHCGTVVTRDEPERGSRLLDRLMDEVVRRQQALRRAGFSSVTEQRDAYPSQERLPWIVLLVDGWDGFQTAYERVDADRPIKIMMRLLREGSAAGVRIVMTGDRSALLGRVSSLVAERLVLRMSDPLDYSLAGLTARAVPDAIPAGRGFLASGSVETQIALLAPDPAGPAQLAALSALAGADSVRVGQRSSAIRIEPLPSDVVLEQAAAGVASPTADENPLWALVGVGGDAALPLGVDLRRDGPALVIAGPPRSGRSSLLVALASWFTQRGVCVAVVAPQRSRLRDLARQPGVLAVSDGRDVDALRDVADSCPGSLVLLADDAEVLLDAPAEQVLLDMLKHAESGAPRALVVAGTTDRMASTYRGITVEARRSRCGLLLSPSSSLDGELLGVRVPKATDPRPGRGVLVVNGEVQPIQAIRG
jgi:S-DNA-T family DNA segregation ATPase FtsK/SpoIIIE